MKKGIKYDAIHTKIRLIRKYNYPIYSVGITFAYGSDLHLKIDNWLKVNNKREEDYLRYIDCRG